MKILLTGAAGFIASHVADAYLEQGHEVIIIDNLATGYLRNLNPRAKFIQLNICSPELEKVFAAEKPDIVNHHAAQISVSLSVKDPLMDTEVNVKGTINLLQNCVKYSTRKVIFASSGGAIYGEAEQYPSTESCPMKPLSPYAVNKAVAESFLYYYGQQFGLEYIILRYANVYGPRQDAHGEAGVVSIFIEKLLQGQQPDLFAFPDQPEGMIRDYVFVKDVVTANLAALNYQGCNTFNIGTGIGTLTGSLYAEIAGQLGSDIKPVKGPAREGDLQRSLLNCDKADKLLSWKSRYSLREGITETLRYFKSKS
jgi:UDP-glucose 4-epimerase